ncbi:MAG: CBS domain-containing protein [Oligoflexia bacterium]|nr:CBS domain-containing protein [Oligoflexia bacterium]
MSLKKIATQNVVTVSPETTVLEAAQRMRELHVGDVVVVKRDGAKKVPIGILTDRDIVVSTVALGVAPGAIAVEEVMLPILVMAKITDNLYHVLNLMKEHGVRRVPLVNAAGLLEGVVSVEDITALLASELADVVKIKERQHKIETERRKKLA